jgi:ABC-2 type transport system permease protein
MIINFSIKLSSRSGGNMRRFWILTKAMFLVHLRNRITLFWNMLFPVFLLVIYGLIFGSSKVQGVNYMSWVLPGVIVLNILAFGLMSSSSMLVNMREDGVLRRLQATPVPALHLVSAYALVNVAIAALQSAAILLAAMLFFDYTPTAIGLLRAAPVIIAAIFASVALGQIVSGVAPKAGVALALGQILYFSQMFLSDMVLPVEDLPGWLQQLAAYLPGYAITQLVRPPLLTGEWSSAPGPQLLVVAAYTLAGGMLAALFFRWAPRS